MTADQLIALGETASRSWTIAGWTMLHFVWVGAAFGLAAVVVRRLLRRAAPEPRYLAAVALLAALAATPVIIAFVVARTLPRTAVASPPMSDDAAAGEHVPDFDSPVQGAERQAHADGEVAASRKPSATPPGRLHAVLHAVLEAAVGILPGLWIAGSTLFLAWIIAGSHGASRLRRSSRLLNDGTIAAACARLAEPLRLWRRVAVGVSDAVAAPVLIGIVRPCILLPAAALTGWTPQQVELVLLHELSHVRRWDNLVNLLQRLVEALLFFQPAVWWLCDWIRLEREYCCDRAVVARTGRTHEYADMLLMLADPPPPRFTMPRRGAVDCGAASMAGQHLTPRLRRLLIQGADPMPTSRTALCLLAAGLAAAAIVHISMQGARTHAADPQVQIPEVASSTEAQRENAAPPRNSDAAAAPSSDTGGTAAAHAPATPEPSVDEKAWPVVIPRARLAPGRSVTLASRREGVLKSVTVREGDRVEAGQVLATLPDDALRVAKIDVEQASTSLKQAELEYAKAREDREKYKASVSEVEVNRLKLEAERARLELARARAELELLKTALVVEAPIAGTVTKVLKHPGESVKAGEPLAEVVNLETMRIEGGVNYRLLWSLRAGAPVSIRISIPDADLAVERETFRGKITFINPALDPVKPPNSDSGDRRQQERIARGRVGRRTHNSRPRTGFSRGQLTQTATRSNPIGFGAGH